MKKIAENVIAVILLLALVCGGAETADGGIDLWWTGGCLAIVALCAFALNRLDKCSTK
ncbi:MAG: hypothetical protein IK114_14070 [Fibrobacter sp.]|nr:hypothetical protein [Fibrobacter sp.]